MDTTTRSCERSQRRTTPPLLAAPWLVFPYGKGMKSQAFHNIAQHQHKTYRRSIPELNGKSFWQKTSHHNWLIIACSDKNQEIMYNAYKWYYGECFLWNPATLQSIRLPNLQEWISKPKKYVFIDCVLTSPPNQDGSAVIFIFSNKKHDVLLLLFCLPGDKQWKTKRIPRGNIAGDFTGKLISLHCLRGKLYVTFERDDRLLEIEKEHLLDDNVKILPVRPLQLVMGNTRFSAIGADCTDIFYAQSDDEIFKIWVTYNSKCKQVIAIEVWRLDLSSMKWEDMHDLGDHVIFLGMKTGFCCSAAKLGLTTGAVYYTLPDDQSLYRFQGNGGNAVTLPCPKLQTPWFPQEWIMLMPEDGQKRMENDGAGEEIEEQKEGNKTCSDTNESCDEQNREEISPWDALNEDVVAAISNYLHPLDYVHYRSVCKANRRVIPPSAQKRGSNSVGYPYISPWLMFPRDNNNTYCFIDPVHDNETYLLSFCESVQGATIRYQNDGWLLMSEIKKVFFYNPFTREIIRLPDLPDDYNISIICFDDPPTAPDCAVFLIDQTSPLDTGILTIMRGDDIWLPHVIPNTNVEKKLMTLHGTAAISYIGVFYCVDCDGTLGTCDGTKENYWSVLATPKKIFNNDLHPNFLVVCGRDILLIKLGHLGTTVRVFRLDFSEMEWVKVENLGKYMLFISETSCLSAIALPNSKMENMIYFPRVCLNGEGILVYSLETGCYQSSSGKNYQHPFNSFYETEGWLSNCTWIQPNWAKSTEQGLDWLKMIQ